MVGIGAYQERTVGNKLLAMQHTSIRELAYKIWLAKGCPEGTAQEDWLAAERQLASFGASSSSASAGHSATGSTGSLSTPSGPSAAASRSAAASSAAPPPASTSNSPGPAKLAQAKPATATATATVASKGVDDTSKGSFPASDPPASHLPDRPPSNAEEKWDAAGLPRKQSPRRNTKPQAPRTQGR